MPANEGVSTRVASPASAYGLTDADDAAARQAGLQIRALVRRSVAIDVEVGGHLLVAKSIVPHGHWTRWLAAETALAADTAGRLMAMAQAFPSISDAADIGRIALAALASPGVPQSVRDHALALATGGTPITVALARRLIADARPCSESAGAATTIDIAPDNYAVEDLEEVTAAVGNAASLPAWMEDFVAASCLALSAERGQDTREFLLKCQISDHTTRALQLGYCPEEHCGVGVAGEQVAIPRGLILPARDRDGRLTSVRVLTSRGRRSTPRVIAGSVGPYALLAGHLQAIACADHLQAVRIWQATGGLIDVIVPDDRLPGGLKPGYALALHPAATAESWYMVASGTRIAPPAIERIGDGSWSADDLRRYAAVLQLLAGPAA